MTFISAETVDISGYQIHKMPTAIARYSIPVSTSSRIDAIFTLCGSNWSLGTTDKRMLKVHLSRRHNGSYGVYEIYGSGARFSGSLANYGTSGVGMVVETSNASSLIIQIHNSYSSGPTSGFSCHVECYGTGKPVQLSSYTGGLYTSNPL